MFTVYDTPLRPLYAYVADLYLGPGWTMELRAFSIATLLSYITGHFCNAHLVITHQSDPDNVLLTCPTATAWPPQSITEEQVQ